MPQEIITLQDLQAFRVQLLNDLRQLLADQTETNPGKEWKEFGGKETPRVRPLIPVRYLRLIHGMEV